MPSEYVDQIGIFRADAAINRTDLDIQSGVMWTALAQNTTVYHRPTTVWNRPCNLGVQHSAISPQQKMA